MGFLFPLFLIAAATVGIPLLIHLFNLRRYKTVLFPHTRFLRAIQLRSRRSSEVRYKWLLALRMLFLLALVAAFAQPFFQKNKSSKTGNQLQVIYIDNNPAMSLKTGVRTGLEIAIGAAEKQLKNAAADTRFLLLSNDKPFSYEPQPAEKILAILSTLGIAPSGKNSNQILATVQSLMQSENANAAELYYYSNFPQGEFSTRPDAENLKNITLHAIAIQPEKRSNIFIDTAFLSSPVLQTGQSNALIVRSKQIRDGEEKATVANATSPVMQLSIDGQVKSAASLHFDASGISIDTLSFSVNDAGWQRILLSVADADIPFDDTFRVAARSAPGLSVLVLNEGQQSPYIQAAFRSYSGFQVQEQSVMNAPKSWKNFNLIILNGITSLPDNVGKQMQEALSGGQSVCLFPGRTSRLDALNNALNYAGDIRVTSLDSTTAPISNIQPGAALIRDIFESIPANVQLPVANWHYAIQAGLSANAQSILSLRNGDPFFAKYASNKGNFYLCASAADLSGSNFPASYFFVPFLYQMAAHSQGGNVYALTAGQAQAAFLPISNSGERNMVHLFGEGLDAIPPQRPAGGGVDVFVDAVTQQPGFYKLSAPSGDSAIIALNGSRSYSALALWSIDNLRKEWPDNRATWQTAETAASNASNTNSSPLPLWKICAILALLLAFAETYVLVARRDISTTNATT